ncbi:MAG: hypothetical protein IJV82_05085 [Oscillospiraceae bacterium]|nr:hypothetical protein [Oscillospiraceae bacterium]
MPEEFTSLRCTDTQAADASYEIRPLEVPLSPAEPVFYNNQGTRIYHTKEGWLRIYPMKASEDGCQVACLFRPDGKHTLYFPAQLWQHYTRPMHCVPQLALELLLLKQNAFLLHSSVVEKHGKAILFSGPSGAGKSTQAELWAKYLAADILNGDRCVIMEKPDGFYGGGSILAGSSGIYRPEQYPIAGIFLVKQAPRNSIRRLGAQALIPMLGQTIVNSWDPEFMEKLTSLYQNLLSQVRVYELCCRPDAGAVQLVYQTLFQK